MSAFGRLAMEVSARLLESREREAVLGDLSESSAGAWIGTIDVLGLVLRRHMLLWRDRRPWIAAFGVAMPTSFLLMGFSLSISLGWLQFVRTGSFGAPRYTTSHELLLMCRVFLLCGWSWTGGFLVGSVSRRTLWVSFFSYCTPCLFCLARFRVESLSRFCLLLFIVPAAIGIWQGLKKSQLSPSGALSIAALVTAFATLSGSVGGESWWTPCTLIMNLALTWPSWYLVATAQNKGSEPELPPTTAHGDARS